MSRESSERPLDNRHMPTLTSDVYDICHSSIDSGVCSISAASELSMHCQSLQSMDRQSRVQSLGYNSESIERCQKQLTALNIAISSDSTVITEKQRLEVPVEEVAPSPELYFELFTQDEDGDTKLHLAIIRPDTEAAAWMIAATALCQSMSLNVQNDRFRQTPLHLAVITNQPRIVRMLVICGALVDIRDRNGNTPLHLACSQGMLDCIKAMTIPVAGVEYSELARYCKMVRLPSIVPPAFQSPNLNCLDYDGCSYLHLVQRLTQPGRMEIFNFLMACGANPNIQDGKSGQSVLHFAVKQRDVEFVRYLCSCSGIDFNLVNYGQQTTLDIAYHLKYDEIGRLLQYKGAVHSDLFYHRSANDSSNDDSETEEYDDYTIGGQPVN